MASTTSPLQRRSGVYVLELKDPGYFYVGSSADLDARVEQHHMVGGTRSVKFVTDHGGVANVIPPLTPPEASLQCNRCYRTGHNETECYARTAAGGRMLPTQTAATTTFPELEESPDNI